MLKTCFESFIIEDESVGMSEKHHADWWYVVTEISVL
jgi:hypothetical protein